MVLSLLTVSFRLLQLIEGFLIVVTKHPKDSLKQEGLTVTSSFRRARIRLTRKGMPEIDSWSRHFCSQCACQFSVSLTQAGVLWEEATSIEELPPSDWPVCRSVGALSWLMVDGKGLANCGWCHHPWADGPGVYKRALSTLSACLGLPSVVEHDQDM